MIPENKQVAVKKALHAAFGVHDFEDIQPLLKGLSSALIFKIMVRGNPYLLRVITRTDAMGDPAFFYGCMKVAAEAALAPPIYYLSIEDRISITGFIEAHPFPIPEAKRRMPLLLRQLHSLPRFPYRIHYFDAMEGFMAKFRATSMLPENATKDMFDSYQHIASIYPRNDQSSWVSCHNDLKPENIIYDGLHPWLVDWEGAFLNDRYLDLAVVANFVVKSEDDEVEYLESYFGEPVDAYKRARFFVMSQMLHLYYFTLFMLFGYTGKPMDVNSLDKPDFRVFIERIWNGEIDLANSDAKLQYAWVHREAFMRNIQTKRLDESLRIIEKG